MASRLRDRSRFGGSSVYQVAKNAAIAAARRNNASLWFAGAPADLAGFVWEDSAGTVPATGTAVIGQLTDRAGSNAATQGATANKPTLELQANGFYGMRFDPSNDFLTTTTDGAYESSFTFIAAINQQSLGTTRAICNSAAPGSVQFYLTTTNQLSVAANAVAIRASTPPTGAGPRVLSATLSGGTLLLFVDGVTAATAAAVPNFSTASASMTLGATATGSLPLANVAFLFARLPALMPDADRIAIERFAALLSGATYA